jgi:hypothetical protein
MSKQSLFIIVLLSASIFCTAQNGITIYANCNYGGASQQLKAGRYSLGSTSIGNGNLSSIKIPAGFKVTIYNGYSPGLGSDNATYTSGVDCLSNDGWNDKANSIVVEKTYNNPFAPNNNSNANNGYYNRGQVTLFSDCNYQGARKSFAEGEYRIEEIGIGNDAASSIRVPYGWSVTVYENGDFGGKKQLYSTDIPCLGNGWNDEISSIRVNRISTGGFNNNQVTLYSDCDYKGQRKSFAPGRHDLPNLGIGNDALSSLKIPMGWTVILYENANWQGRSEVFTSDIDCLNSNWNDQVSSIEIKRGYGGGNNNNYNGNYNSVTVFADCNYGGSKKSFAPGWYDINDLGVGNDNISSIVVPYGWRIILYNNAGFGGSSQVYTSDQNCLNFSWNNKTSSLKVERN